MTGTYQWTVTARDASGNADRDGAAPRSRSTRQLQATLRPVIETPEGTGLGKTLTLTAPAWSPGGVSVTTTYQWLRDGDPHHRCDGRRRTRWSTADFGKSITVRATGKAPGYLDGVSTSLPVSPDLR